MSSLLEFAVNTVTSHPTASKAGAVIFTYMFIIRQLRFRRINALLKKYPDPTLPLRDINVAKEVMSNFDDYEFPFLNVVSLEFALFKTYAIPSISKILAATKQFTNNCLRRTDDTEFILLEIKELYSRKQYREMTNGGIEDHAAEENDKLRRQISRDKLNFIHGQYNIKQSDYLYTLALFVLEPSRWIDRFEWRQSTELEKNSILAYWIETGEYMKIENIPRSLRELEEWAEEYEKEYMVYSSTNPIIADVTTDLLLSLAPKFMHPFGRKAVSALLNDRLRKAFGLSPPPMGLTTVLTSLLKLRGLFNRFFLPPRIYPLIRTALKADPKNGNRYVARWNKYGVVYPNGYKVEDLGPDKFIGKCPFTYDTSPIKSK
ncbi:hypothetical protein BGZ76_009332 [Entomortierella beljakovae]|nr:hypothetical protein BGZ76_009332 [Entomortierella beljakovae]